MVLAGDKSIRPVDFFDESELDVVDWVLALFYAAGALPTGAHVQGALFIASQYIPRLGEILEFGVYGGGPWSEEVQDILAILRDNGWLVRTRRGLSLDDKGRRSAEDSWNKLEKREKEILGKVANLVGQMTRKELLIYICTLYGCPSESEAYKEIEGKRKQLALNILRKNLVSVELAAKIAGLSLPQFIRYLKTRGYKPYGGYSNKEGVYGRAWF